MASVSLGNQKFVGTANFPIGMVQQLATQLLGKNVTADFSQNTLTISQGGTQLVSVDLSGSAREVWASIADVLFSGAAVSDIGIVDRVEYVQGYSRGIDWRDMAQSTTINENRYADSNLTVSVNNAAFTIDGFGDHFQKLVGIGLQRNDGNTGEGAMMEVGQGHAFIRVNTSNEIEVNTSLGDGVGNETWSPLSHAGGNITLASGDDNFLVFEVVEVVPGNPANYELVGAFTDGTNYFELNNKIFTPGTVSGDNLGFSRSASQRGQVMSFRAIDSSGYLRHSQLETILRQHLLDKWVFGYARLIGGDTQRGVTFNTRVDLATGSQVGGEALRSIQPVNVVYQASGVGTASGELVASVSLPADYASYDFIHVTEVIVGEPNEWRHTTVSTALLDSGHVQSTDNIRIQGASDMAWVAGTREIAIVGGSQDIYRVMLVDV